eukprot:1885447-Prymnesium_polylepis.2
MGRAMGKSMRKGGRESSALCTVRAARRRAPRVAMSPRAVTLKLPGPSSPGGRGSERLKNRDKLVHPGLDLVACEPPPGRAPGSSGSMAPPRAARAAPPFHRPRRPLPGSPARERA